MNDFIAKRSEFIAAAEPGLASARELARITDEAVRRLAALSAGLHAGRWAITALGGWGSGALLPASDLDLLILSDAPERALKPFVEAVLYPLWDAGLKVGHQVRSPKQQLRGMRDDLKTCTAALTARALAGDTRWANAVLSDCAADAHKRRRELLRAIAQRNRPGSPFLLEPDLKDGAGGRRDYDELVWVAAIEAGAVTHDPLSLLDAGLISVEELEGAAAAAELVAAARWELHLAGEHNLLTPESAALLRTDPACVQQALGATWLACNRVRRRVSGGVVEPDVPLRPEEALELFDAGESALPALEEAAQAGRFEALVPGMRDLMALRRPGLGHTLTVGAHSLAATASLASIAEAGGTAARSASAIVHPYALTVATLAHDIGKMAGGAEHPAAGAGPARDIALRFGLPPAQAEDVSELVRLHLALVETATRADIDDEDAILHAASTIGRRELVAPLHLLTIADSCATGPATWTPWMDALLGSLVARLDVALSDDVDGAGLASRGETVRAAALAAIPGALDAERGFVECAPLRYLASREPSEIAADARLVSDLSALRAVENVRIAVKPGPVAGTFLLHIAAKDRPELFARLAGAISLAGLDILSADAYPAPGGLALDIFTVTSATLATVDPATWAALERLTHAALSDRLELETRLAERARHYPPRARGEVGVEVGSAGWDTTIRVKAPDRPGLLYDLARAVSASGLDIRWAKVLTVEGMAIDTFHAVGPDGRAEDNPGVLGHLAMRLRESA